MRWLGSLLLPTQLPTPDRRAWGVALSACASCSSPVLPATRHPPEIIRSWVLGVSRLTAIAIREARAISSAAIPASPSVHADRHQVPETRRARDGTLIVAPAPAEAHMPGLISESRCPDAVPSRRFPEGPVPHRGCAAGAACADGLDGREWTLPAQRLPGSRAATAAPSSTVTLEREWLPRLSAGSRSHCQRLQSGCARCRRGAHPRPKALARLPVTQPLPSAILDPARCLPFGTRPEPNRRSATTSASSSGEGWSNPKTLARTPCRARDEQAFIDAVLDWFHKERFFYTLAPPLLGANSVDGFLFETRRGFCEHYAGAFVVLLRAAGIPARVVTGYQGGTINPNGNYMIVRQSDAHAWAEALVGGHGGVSIRPPRSRRHASSWALAVRPPAS
jgi:hypothetical protein